jgi:hypothetical protein
MEGGREGGREGKRERGREPAQHAAHAVLKAHPNQQDAGSGGMRAHLHEREREGERDVRIHLYVCARTCMRERFYVCARTCMRARGKVPRSRGSVRRTLRHVEREREGGERGGGGERERERERERENERESLGSECGKKRCRSASLIPTLPPTTGTPPTHTPSSHTQMLKRMRARVFVCG